jgi:hypothetical protein
LFAKGIVAGPDRRLWITRTDEVVRFDPSDPRGTVAAFPVAGLNQSRTIVSDGRVLWSASGDRLFSIALDGNATPTRIRDMDARGLAVGGDGRVWIADSRGIDPRLTIVDPAAPLTPAFVSVSRGPQQIVAGAGTQMAYTDPIADPQEVGLVTLPDLVARRTQVPGTDPFGIAFGEDGAYWVANFGSHDLTRLAPDGTVTRLGGLTPLSGPRMIARGNGGTLWVSLEVAERVALVTGLEAPRVDPPIVVPPRVDPPRVDPPKTPDTTKPVIGGLALSGRPSAGARALGIRFTLSERATVTARLLAAAPGKRSTGACVKPTRKLRRAPRCTRWVQVAVARGERAAGTLTTALRRGGGRTLPLGRYRVVVSARDGAGNAAVTRSLTVRLTKR